VIKLLDEGKIRFERVGSRQRIMLRHLLAYRERRRAEQYAALETMAADTDDEEDLADALAQIREARKVVATRRRALRG
jgi:hypothetical protein